MIIYKLIFHREAKIYPFSKTVWGENAYENIKWKQKKNYNNEPTNKCGCKESTTIPVSLETVWGKQL